MTELPTALLRCEWPPSDGLRPGDERFDAVLESVRKDGIKHPLVIRSDWQVAAERAAEVLAVGSRCHRHPPTGVEAGSGAAERARPGIDIARAVTGTSGKRHDDDTDTLIANGLRASDGHHGHGSPRGDGSDNLVAAISARGDDDRGRIGPSPDSRGVRTPHGLAGRSHDLDDLAIPISGDALRGEGTANTPSADAEGRVRLRDPGLGVGAPGDPAYTVNATEPGAVLMGSLREHVRPGSNTDYTVIQENAATLNSGGNDGGFRTEPGEHLVAFVKQGAEHHDDGETWGAGDVTGSLDAISNIPRTRTAVIGSGMADDPLLPLGLDSHRYRCCGNGVVAPVAEWLGERLLGLVGGRVGR